MEPYVKNPLFLTQGKRFTNFDMLVREAWANWLITVVIQKITGDRQTFGEKKDGDGVVWNVDKQNGFVVEHVCAMDYPAGKQLPTGEERIIWAVEHKIKRGPEYAKDKALVVFFDGAKKFYRSKIREAIYKRHNFKIVFCVGLLEIKDGAYSYIVSEFRDTFKDRSVSHIVYVNQDFTDWQIKQQME
ncbi:MAG: Uncharacterized protein G01um101431_1074 [Parcubacteria group bacterium Gr01-1014_31]|nr:MAG: Uncharacterized protein G01um101431_1074 [Parcubacteria group bacterium Gr01-1014_31]